MKKNDHILNPCLDPQALRRVSNLAPDFRIAIINSLGPFTCVAAWPQRGEAGVAEAALASAKQRGCGEHQGGEG